MNAYAEMLPGNTDADACYPDADLDADLYIYYACWLRCWLIYQRIMPLWCILYTLKSVFKEILYNEHISGSLSKNDGIESPK